MNPGPTYTCRGQFVDWPPRYSSAAFTINGDGTVTDTRNKLSWQRDLPTAYPDCSESPSDNTFGCTWEEAKKHCANLVLAGSGWRLPTFAELGSLVDDTRYGPALDPAAFPYPTGAPSGWEWGRYEVWTASSHAEEPAKSAWEVDFTYGTRVWETKTERHNVRCVRGDAATAAMGGASNLRYTFPLPELVYDVYTRLTWQRTADANLYDYASAHSFCANMNLDGGRFRLPSRDELLSLVDPTRINPAIVSNALPNTPFKDDAAFWTSTPDLAVDENHWYVQFDIGRSSSARPTDMLHVRCVR